MEAVEENLSSRLANFDGPTFFYNDRLAMASVTRSTRRAEALQPHHANLNHSHHRRPAGRTTNNGHLSRSEPAGATANTIAEGRTNTKRTLEKTDTEGELENWDLKPKRTRIAVEILSRVPAPEPAAPPQPKGQPKLLAKAPANTSKDKQAPSQRPNPNHDTNTHNTNEINTNSKENGDGQLTKHQAKVHNGIKHELDRLQPGMDAQPTTKEQGRKLRSQEATRFKSELSAYFPEYDEIIGNEEKENRRFCQSDLVTL